MTLQCQRHWTRNRRYPSLSSAVAVAVAVAVGHWQGVPVPVPIAVTLAVAVTEASRLDLTRKLLR